MWMKFVGFLLFIGLSGGRVAHAQVEPLTISSLCGDTTVHTARLHRGPVQNLRGIVVLKNGDTLSGCMMLINNLCAFPKENDREYRFIKPKDIIKVVLQIYSLYRKPVELYTMDNRPMRGAFWRLIETKGSFSVYDRSEGVFSDLSSTEVRGNNVSKNGFNDFMYIVSKDNHAERIYGRLSVVSGMLLVDTDAKEKMLKYINRKYHKRFSAADFRTEMEMVDYILTQANAAAG